MPITALDRLKLAREDFDAQEKLYNTLILGLRFYVGIAALMGGWSLTLVDIDDIRAEWDVWFVIVSTIGFWVALLCVIYHLFLLFKGDHWTIPRTFDHYLTWERQRFKQLRSGDFDTGEKTPAQFAEDEMLEQMTGAYADTACVNRTANLRRQTLITKVGKLLLVALIMLGIQGLTGMIYSQRHGEQRKQQLVQTAAAPTAPAGSGRHDQP